MLTATLTINIGFISIFPLVRTGLKPPLTLDCNALFAKLKLQIQKGKSIARTPKKCKKIVLLLDTVG